MHRIIPCRLKVLLSRPIPLNDLVQYVEKADLAEDSPLI
jgi:hypothetical protein